MKLLYSLRLDQRNRITLSLPLLSLRTDSKDVGLLLPLPILNLFMVFRRRDFT